MMLKKNGFYLLEKWALLTGLIHGFSSISLGNMNGDDEKQVRENRIKFVQSVTKLRQKIFSVHQEHQAKILVLNKNNLINQIDEISADGIMTRKKMFVY